MSKLQVYPDAFYEAQRGVQKENSKPDIHSQLRCIKCCLCYRVIPRSQWQKAKCERALHLPYNTVLLQSVQQALPSYSVKNKAFPTSLCPTCKRKIYDYLSFKANSTSQPASTSHSENSKSRTASHSSSQFEKEILDRDVFYASYERPLRTKGAEQSTCGGEKSCRICKAATQECLVCAEFFEQSKNFALPQKRKQLRANERKNPCPKNPECHHLNHNVAHHRLLAHPNNLCVRSFCQKTNAENEQ